MKTRLLLVDDHSLFRESLARFLQTQPDFEIVGSCDSVSEALRLVGSRDVDLVLLDWDLGAEKGLGFVDEARRTGYRGQVLLVTAGISESDAAQLLPKGIGGVFTKHLSPTLLIQSIREVMQGKAWYNRDFLNRALELAVGSSEPTRKRLTERERLVLSSILEGLANKEIADRLHISEAAVKSSLQQLFAKTGVRTRSQLVRVALENYRDQL